ncbi:MAG: type I-E CRISPR-associated protein Cas6/Cse3/CasE [Chloroflexi bacterium]|nr:type I-E CRISPR-associated protein Cas6/Cse3/CasE [Chloroflexota bacterium]
MYLSQLTLNPRSRQVRSEVSQPYELHRTLMRAFPAIDQGGPGRVLFRLESQADVGQAGFKVLVQSDQEPNWAWLDNTSHYLLPSLDPNPASKRFEPVFQPGQRFYFRLRANPTKRLLRDDPERELKKGQRLGLYKEEEQRDWLARKAEQGSFALLGVTVTAEGKIGGKTKERHDLALLAVRFEGLLQVTGPAQFSQTLQEGIGSGKGLGFGLLSLARA